jgi:ferredoxin-thioredoxin reductase catalytic subunit
MMDGRQLYQQLKAVQESKGYFFNRDMEKTMFLIEGLLTNRERYGYMCCPCRLAKEDRQADQDIICPCDYRETDVAEYGSCYCGLYVSKQWNEEDREHVYVPERRQVEKC